jgi:YidC/Oxa1 family membrane protein insertase
MALWNSFVGALESILLWLSTLTGSLGLGIVLFTILTRIVLLPLTIKQLQSSKKMQELQPLIQELRRKHGKDQQKFTQEMTKLYREHQANPAGGCLPIFIQLPIFIGVYQAVQVLAMNAEVAGSFLWLPSLTERDPYFVLPVLSIVLQLLTSLMAMPKIQDAQQKIMSQTMLVMPIVFGYVAFTFNSGAVLYWVVGSLLAVIQQFFVSGWGSLTNYLPFLPERKGYFTPTIPVVPTATEVVADADEPAGEKVDPFWGPLAKLQTSTPSGSASATEAAITDAKRQASGGKKRR